MSNDSAYSTAKKLISGGYIKTLTELVDVVPKTRLARDMKTSPERFNNLLANPELFMFKDAYKIAELVGVDRKLILDLVHNQAEAQSKGRRKK